MDQTSLRSNNNHLANDSPEMRAWRLKRVRNLANLTREQMCEDGEINRNTLISWENARFGGLTLSGASKVLAKITQEGVHTSLDWLMYGAGPEPSVNPIPLMQENKQTEFNEDIIIAYEIAFFKAKNADAIDFTVDDDGMLPQYKENDRVAGKKKTGDDIRLTLGRDCIVQLENGETLLRNVREGINTETYSLICNNPSIKNRSSIILNVRLAFAAPVIWHRKKEN